MRFVFLIVCLMGCAEAPTMPAGAVPLDPVPAWYADSWREIEECSGQRGDFARVAFYVYRDRDIIAVNNRNTASVWYERRIYVTRQSEADPKAVRYAMLRYLLPGANEEPSIYTEGLCGHLVH